MKEYYIGTLTDGTNFRTGDPYPFNSNLRYCKGEIFKIGEIIPVKLGIFNICFVSQESLTPDESEKWLKL